MQLANYCESRNLGEVFYETDVRLPAQPRGGDLVYRPDIACFSPAAAARIGSRIEVVPDLVVEVLSPESRDADMKMKFSDYARAGVREYWVIDPDSGGFFFFRLRHDTFQPVAVTGDAYQSEALPHFTLNLAKIRAAAAL